jgi:hypothetical protein
MLSLCLPRAAQPGNVTAISVGRGGGSAGELRRGFVDASDPSQTIGAEHAIMRTHPVTGRKALFLGRRRNAYTPGLPLAESEALLDAYGPTLPSRDSAGTTSGGRAT